MIVTFAPIVSSRNGSAIIMAVSSRNNKRSVMAEPKSGGVMKSIALITALSLTAFNSLALAQDRIAVAPASVTMPTITL